MMQRPWLIQRLEKPWSMPQMKDNPFSFGGGLKNGGLRDEAMDLLRGIFSFDYMGAAEFEFGEVPKALQRVASVGDDLSAWEVRFPLAQVRRPWRDKSTDEPEGDAVVYGISRADDAAEIKKLIRGWAKGKGEQLKEPTRLPDALRPDAEYPTRVCGWLELDNGYFFFTDREMWQQTADLFGVSTEAVAAS